MQTSKRPVCVYLCLVSRNNYQYFHPSERNSVFVYCSIKVLFLLLLVLSMWLEFLHDYEIVLFQKYYSKGAISDHFHLVVKVLVYHLFYHLETLLHFGEIFHRLFYLSLENLIIDLTPRFNLRRVPQYEQL